VDVGGKGYDDAGQTAYLDSTLRWGLDWLIKAHPNSDTLYVQVGNGMFIFTSLLFILLMFGPSRKRRYLLGG
jgi:hypothetical protein